MTYVKTSQQVNSLFLQALYTHLIFAILTSHSFCSLFITIRYQQYFLQLHRSLTWLLHSTIVHGSQVLFSSYKLPKYLLCITFCKVFMAVGVDMLTLPEGSWIVLLSEHSINMQTWQSVPSQEPSVWIGHSFQAYTVDLSPAERLIRTIYRGRVR